MTPHQQPTPSSLAVLYVGGCLPTRVAAVFAGLGAKAYRWLCGCYFRLGQVSICHRACCLLGTASDEGDEHLVQ